ncbi:MAG TPA: hypothetical protein VKA27_07510, partial [Sunxiuqinia sp.]|nr:hypothetical protein [Sunxiuqinia sp.]
GFWNLDLTLNNQSDHKIDLTNVSKPAVGYMQDGVILDATPLEDITSQKDIPVGKSLEIRFKVPVNRVNADQKLTLFTQTHDLNRGELATIHLK